MKIGKATVDFKALLIEGPAGHYSMEPKIMKLLKVLVDHAGEVMSREDLITAVWGVEFGGDERLSRAISILRKALGDKRGQHTHIATISRVGYRLIAPIENIDRLAKAPPHDQSALTEDRLIVSDNSAQMGTDLGSQAERSGQTDAVLSRRSGLSFKALAALSGLFAACAIIGVLAFSGVRPEGAQSLQARMERGFSHVENFTPKGAIEEAQDIFRAILSDDPSHAAARAGLAFSVFREYTYLERDPALLQRAKAHSQAALREDEHLALANIAVAWAAEFDGELERAHQYLDRADILDPDNPLALEARYRTFGKQNQDDKALDVINSAIAAYPDKALFYTYRGGFYQKAGNPAASEADYRKAISLSPDNSRTYAELSHTLYLQGRTDEAIDVIQDGLKISEEALLYNNLGAYLFFQGQYDLAVPAFEKTLELSGDTHSYLYWANLGDAYRWSQNNIDEAANSYRRALQLLQTDLDRFPDDANLKSRAALFNAKLGNLDDAQDYMNSFDLTPASPSIQLYRAVVTYEIMSNRAMALQSLEAALAANYPLIEILNDPELAQLRQDPSYHRLLAKTKND